MTTAFQPIANGIANTTPRTSPGKPAEQLRVLIVDDEESILWSLSQNLSFAQEGYTVGTAGTAEDALEMLKTTKVDVIISDLKLPGMNGLELMKAVRRISPSTRAILMTAYGNNAVLEKACDEGFIAYLEKPFSIDLLLNYINGSPQPSVKVCAELVEIDLFDILEFYSRKRLDLVLKLTAAQGEGLLALRQGTLVHAEFDKLEGAEALASIVYADHATVTSLPPELARTILESSIPTLNLTEEDIRAIKESPLPIETTRILRGQKRAAPQIDLGPVTNTDPAQVFRSTTSANRKSRQRKSSASDVNRMSMILQSEPPQADEPRIKLDDFSKEELALSPDPADPSTAEGALTPKDKQLAIRNLINAGVENFKLHNLDQARKCWLLALRLDPECPQARKNLQVLETTLLKTKTCQ